MLKARMPALRTRLTFTLPRWRCASHTKFAVAVSFVWIALYNHRFWSESFVAMWRPSPGAAAFLGSLFLLVLFLQSAVLLLMPGRMLLRATASALCVAAALNAYFADQYGVLVDHDMIRNVVETDVSEVSGLMSTTLWDYLIFLGIIPAVLVWRVELPQIRWQRQVLQRAVFISAGLLFCAVGVFANSAGYATFLRTHKPIRFLIAPGSAVAGTVSYVLKAVQPPPPALVDPGGAPSRVGVASRKPLLFFLVIGETARAANFQLGGYPRPTNPKLSEIDHLVYFNNVSSCGTSTAISVPCVFSHLGHAARDGEEPSRYFNLLDMLSRAGVDVEWRDNNAGCKGVCARVRSVRLEGGSGDELCANDYCFDEALVSGLQERLRSISRDTLIVFHQIGSHGPAYTRRYPPQFERFRPVCRSSELDRCSRDEVVNAYDNTILYTDHNLAAQIELLRSLEDRADTALLYVSDHGESLGERRVYLHGMPYAIAPAEQKRVPLLVWTSKDFQLRAGLRESCLEGRSQEPLTHDNVFHTVMGAMEVRNRTYRSQLDLLAPCKAKAG
jgi:lipid A ethanolaminephosphotransferase